MIHNIKNISQEATLKTSIAEPTWAVHTKYSDTQLPKLERWELDQ